MIPKNVLKSTCAVFAVVLVLYAQTPTKIDVGKINLGESTANRDISSGLTSNDHNHYPTTAAVVAYVASHGGSGGASIYGTVSNTVTTPTTTVCAGNDSTDDTSCLQGALDAVISGTGGARAGGALVLQAGTYKITAPIVLNNVRGLQFRGVSNGLVKIHWTGASNRPAIWCKNCHDVTFSDFTINSSVSFPLEEAIMFGNYNQESGSIDPGHNTVERLVVQGSTTAGLQAGFVKPETKFYGTVSVTTGSATVTWVSGGTFSTAGGTDWRSMVGNQIRIGVYPTSYTVYTVASVASSTSLTLTSVYAGSTNGNIAYSAPPYDGNNDFSLYMHNVVSNYSGAAFVQGHSQAHNDIMLNNQCYPYGGKACVAGSIDGTVGVHAGFEWRGGGSFGASAADFRLNNSPIPIFISGLSSENSRALLDSTVGANGTSLPVTIENVRWAAGGLVDSSCNQASGLSNTIVVNYNYAGPFVLRNSQFYGCLAAGNTFNVPLQMHWSFGTGQYRPSFVVEDVMMESSSTSFATTFVNDGVGNSAVPTNARNFTAQNSNTSYTNLDISRTTTNPHICTSDCAINLYDDVVLMNCSAACAVELPRYDFYGVELAGAVGKTIVIQDISGNAGTNNVTVRRATGDVNTPLVTIDGASSKVINANYGALTLMLRPSTKVGVISKNY